MLARERGLNFITTLLAISYTSSIERNGRGHDLAEIQSVEGIVEQDHFGVRAITFVPISLISDDRSCRSRAILPIDAMKSHSPYRNSFDFDHEYDIRRRLLGQALYPFTFTGFRDREYCRNELPDFRIIEPAQKKWNIFF